MWLGPRRRRSTRSCAHGRRRTRLRSRRPPWIWSRNGSSASTRAGYRRCCMRRIAQPPISCGGPGSPQDWHGLGYTEGSRTGRDRSPRKPGVADLVTRSVADAVDSVLLTRWGPDQFDDRRALSTRIEEAVAHVEDVNARLSAHLWRLTLELESLNAVGVLRLLRTLDGLASETDQPRARFFAESRRAMFALVQGDFERVTAALPGIDSAGSAAAIVDSQTVLHSLSGQLAPSRHAARWLAEAVLYEEFRLHKVQLLRAVFSAPGCVGGFRPCGIVAAARCRGGTAQCPPRRGLAPHHDVADACCDPDQRKVVVAQWYRAAGAVCRSSGGQRGRGHVPRCVADVLFRTALALGERTTAQGWCDHAAQCYRRLGARWWLDALDAPLPSPPPPWAALSCILSDRAWLLGCRCRIDLGAAGCQGTALPA